MRSSRINIHFKHYNRNAPDSSDALLELTDVDSLARKAQSLLVCCGNSLSQYLLGVQALWAWSEVLPVD